MEYKYEHIKFTNEWFLNYIKSVVPKEILDITDNETRGIMISNFLHELNKNIFNNKNIKKLNLKKYKNNVANP